MFNTNPIVINVVKLAKSHSFSKVLVAVDGSPESMAAVDRAMQIAKNDDAELIAFNVLQLPVMTHYTPAVLDSVLEKGTAEVDSWFADIKRRAQEAGLKVKTEMSRGFGSPSSEIVGYADKENVDLIVTGTRGRGRLKKALLGSTASGVVMNATCTVMVVR